MATKKTNSRNTAKNTAQPAKQAEEPKAVDSMSVDELAKMFIQNDTQTIERLKEENTPEPVIEEIKTPEPEKVNELDKLVNEVILEQPKEENKTEQEPVQEKPIVNKNPEHTETAQPAKPQQPNTNRAVYGYDHFGIIYGY